MCGIVGFFNIGTEEELRDATAKVAHRGPDNMCVEWLPGDNTGLGHQRLSIIDLSTEGNQPMYNTITGDWIVYNGEIFNYEEVRKRLQEIGLVLQTNSDTEVILKAYEYWGKACLEQLNGMFAFAIYNSKNKCVFAARDRMGIKPFYYYYSGDGLVIASEIKSILSCRAYKKEVDNRAIHTPVHYQAGELTGFKEIKKLLPAHFLEFQKNELQIKNYWQLNVKEEHIEDTEAIDKLDTLLTDAVRLQMTADVEVGVFLSGGLDSSIISALMPKFTNKRLNSYTIRFAEKDLKLQGNVNDAFYAKKVADKLGFKHHEFLIKPDIASLLPKMIYHLDEPIADPAAINTYLISQAARETGIKVLLNGMGGDEVFAGYRAQLACLKANIYASVPFLLRTPFEKAISLLPESSKTKNYKYIRWMKRFTEFAGKPKFERYLLATNSALGAINFNEYYIDGGIYDKSYFVEYQKDNWLNQEVNYLTRICYNDTKVYMPDHNLCYSDKATMAASVESRPPLIDHRIVEFMFSLDPSFRIRSGQQKWLLKKVAERYIDDEILNRPKAPFSAPMRSWLKNELREMVHDLLSERTVRERGIYNASFVQNLILQNEKGLRDNSQLIWRLMVNELWFRTYFDK